MSVVSPNHRRRWFSTAGLTLIEVIGVVSVLAIIGAAMAPTFIKRLDKAAKDAEATSQKTLSDAYVRTSLVARVFSTNFVQTLAGYLNETTNRVTDTKRKLPRRFLVDPNLNINGNGLPYSQAAAGSTSLPINGRLMIISTIAKALPTINATASEFNQIWSASEGTVPAPLVSSWGGRGDDLLIERIELAPLFHKVVLVNADPPPHIGRYSIDTDSTILTVAALGSGQPNRVVAYYMDGTVINFYPKTNVVVDFPEIIRADVSFVYQNNRWARSLGADDEIIGDFGDLVDRFLQPPAPCDPKFGATQRAVISAFYNYLWGYSTWAFGDPGAIPSVVPFAGSGGGGGGVNFPSYTVVKDAKDQMGTFTYNLIQ